MAPKHSKAILTTKGTKKHEVKSFVVLRGLRGSILLIALMLSFAVYAQAQHTQQPQSPPEPETIRPPATALTIEQMQKLRAVIETSMGEITIEFYPEAAPNHVRQFVWLAQAGYFDGMSVSRIIPKFIIQSGNPASWAESSPNQKRRFDIQKLKAEYDSNIKHERGAVSMARPNDDPDGGTAHFFICALKASSLDGQYSVFGHVINGMDVVDAIAAAPIAEGSQDKPRDRIEVKRITIKEAETPKP